MSEQNKDVVLKFMQAMGTNDPELAAACIAPDAQAVAKGYGKFAGTRKADVMIGMIEAFKQLMPTGLNFTIVNVIADGDRIAVEAEGNATTSAGTAYRNQYCFVFTLEGGKIRNVNEYFCTVHADEVLWPLVAPMTDELPAS
ncbi:MAG: nuclear transport factor 2 family protein [Novosphingobium sp.]|nr:nuclear transport factor 2 family protein [Novosphingobium sp.]